LLPVIDRVRPIKSRLVIAAGLYIIGSDMILKIGTIENYDNNILIAGANMKPGKNNINDKKHTSPPLMKGPSVKTCKLKANVEPKQILKVDAPIQEIQELQKPT
jgi:hypothetical protein